VNEYSFLKSKNMIKLKLYMTAPWMLPYRDLYSWYLLCGSEIQDGCHYRT